jgi:LysM repeat protein
MGKQRKLPKIAKRYKKILKGRGRSKGEGRTLTTGLTKGQGLLKTDPNLSLQPLGKKLTRGKKVYKTIFSSKGTKESDMAQFAQKNKKEKESKLEFPKTTGAFTIQKGDTLSKISKMTGKSIKEIMAANKDITDPNKIRAGAGLKGLGKRSDYTTQIKKDTKPAQKMPVNKPGTAKSKSATQINRELKAKINPPKPTTNIFKVKKGESTTRAADAKKKQEAAQKKLGRGFTMPGKAEPKKLTAKEKRNKMLARLSFRSAQAMKPGEGREKAMERARKIQQRNLPKKNTKKYPAESLVKRGRIIFGTDKDMQIANKAFGSSAKDYTEVRMNKKSKGKGAGASLRGMGAVVK